LGENVEEIMEIWKGVREKGVTGGLVKIESKQNTVTALFRFRFDRSGAPR